MLRLEFRLNRSERNRLEVHLRLARSIRLSLQMPNMMRRKGTSPRSSASPAGSVVLRFFLAARLCAAQKAALLPKQQERHQNDGRYYAQYGAAYCARARRSETC